MKTMVSRSCFTFPSTLVHYFIVCVSAFGVAVESERN